MNKGVVFLVFLFVLMMGGDQVKAKLHQQNGGVTKDTIVMLGDTELYIAIPSVSAERYPVVMAIHGSGREARSYLPNDDRSARFYVHQRDLAVRSGFMFVVVSNGPDTWGTKKGLENVLAAYDYVKNHYRVEKAWNFWTTSAGGALFIRLAKSNPEIIRRAMGTFPVYNLEESYSRLESARKAWGNLDSVRKYNPIYFPDVLTGIPYLIFHGKADTAVPIDEHSGRLQKDVNSLGGNVQLKMVQGGHSTDNWNMYDDSLILRFLINKEL